LRRRKAELELAPPPHSGKNLWAHLERVRHYTAPD
jgi:hypothetical protein